MDADKKRDTQFMLAALNLAEKGRDTTSPNPRVGCVIADAQGNVIGEGYHQRAGEAHAEIIALSQAGEKARGACAYVTLEPCDHEGRTGPCTAALIAAGLQTVVYAMEDPNPQVSGKGLQALRSAGIEVRGPIQENAALELNRGFCKRMLKGLPWVRCKMAMSLDGRTAMADGKSKWITSPAAREDVQRLRASSCAIITGVGTVLEDDPALTVRLKNTDRQALRVVLDSKLRTPHDAELFKSPGEIILACTEANKVFSAQNVKVIPLPDKSGHAVDLFALLQYLAREKACNEVMIEAGPILSGAFLAAGLLDEMVIYMAAKLMGKSARPLFDITINSMAASLPLSIQDTRMVGDNWRITAIPDLDA